VLGTAAIDPRIVARIVQGCAATAGFDPAALGGHSLKRGELTTGMDRGVHPTRLKQLGRHKSYAVLDEYLEVGAPFEGHPLSGVLYWPTTRRASGAHPAQQVRRHARLSDDHAGEPFLSDGFTQPLTARSKVGRSSRRRLAVATPSMISANSARFSSRISPIRCSMLSGVR